MYRVEVPALHGGVLFLYLTQTLLKMLLKTADLLWNELEEVEDLVCYFTGIDTRNAVDTQIGFHSCDSLPGHEDLSHILDMNL